MPEPIHPSIELFSKSIQQVTQCNRQGDDKKSTQLFETFFLGLQEISQLFKNPITTLGDNNPQNNKNMGNNSGTL
ncbi:MAG TPA: hypothetical protein PLW93_02650 [Candidatus Absconditabacterales bacterium]|nr:hypothetical protein [Candidatus Absconditabacterales bacterium]HNG97149.1 hypothetical protein [Candidatus Absconditabacterales bacterium]